MGNLKFMARADERKTSCNLAKNWVGLLLSQRVFVVAFLLLSLHVFALRLCAQQNNLTPNLLINPGAETGTLANWTIGGPGTPTVDSGTFDSGINPHTGSYDFLGHDSASDTLSQTVSLLTQGITAADLDSGNLYANLSFWEQGLNQGTPSDDAFVTLTFLDSNGAAISMVNSGEVDSHDNAWMNFQSYYPLPTGTRSITYTMNFMRHAGSDLDAFVDDNSLQVSTTSGLLLSAKTLTFGNQMVGTTSAAQVVTVTNPNTATINISQIALEAGANPTDFAQTNNCPAALVQNASCQITFTFTPHGVGNKTAGLLIFTDSMPSQQGVNVSGVGTGGILQVNPGNLKTIAGNGTAGYTGDGGAAIAAELNQPNGIGFDPSGNLYIADLANAVVRKVDTAGNITTFAGNGTAGYLGDGGPAIKAELFQPFSVTSDTAGNIYIQDTGNDVVRKVDNKGMITTFAGTGTAGHSGDGGPATAARFNENQGARFDKAGNLYVPQCFGASIRKIDTSGNITTVAGNFTEGFSGDGGQATSAELQCPSGVAIDDAGNLYIADDGNNRVRKVDTSGIITTIAGDGNGAFKGDGGPATAAELNLPNDVVLDPAGNLYVADSGNNAVRKIDAKGVITTPIGGLQNAGSAGVNTPLALTVDPAGNLYFSDSGNSAIREFFPAGTVPFPSTSIGTTAPVQTLSLSNIGNVAINIASSASFTLSGNSSDFSLTGGTCLAGATLAADQGSCTLQISFTPTAVGLRTLVVSIVDTALNSPQSFTISGIGAATMPTLKWTPPASITYGTPLSVTQLDATVTGATGAAVAGTFAYTPAAGTVLAVGMHTLDVTFTSTDPNYSSISGSVPITVTQATPTLTWATPASIAYGIPLGPDQLDAAATGVSGAALPGIFTYTPAAGTLLTPGTQTLHVAFAPEDATDYETASTDVQILVTGLSLSSLSPNTARQGDPDTRITLTGAGFVTTSVAQVKGVAIATTYVNPTTLMAVIPAASLTQIGALPITVVDPTIDSTSNPETFTVTSPTAAATLTGPSTTPPGSQPTVTLKLTQPYPIAVTAVFTLSFAGSAMPPVDDPAIQFSGGGRTFTAVIPANTTAFPPVRLQSGTDAGTITVDVALTAGGLNVTPTTLAPVEIVVPAADPVLSSASIKRNGDQLVVTVEGFSNTREVSQATFHFTGIAGASIATPDVTVQVTPIFTTWFGSTPSIAYGSSFTYTQSFQVSEDAATISSVEVTITNIVGQSNQKVTP